ncbi:MAG: hypothetical protein LBT66_06800 [Methanobrevibacter sp.]|jgi:predicted nuclease with TOPRIM domain|nr:hypothetical protein [Candidatus Methanovirga meridionalis]
MEFNKKNKDYVVDLEDNNHKPDSKDSNLETPDFNNLNFIDFNFDDDVSSDLDNNDYKTEVNHSNNKTREESSNFNEFEDLDSEFSSNSLDFKYDALELNSNSKLFIDVRIITDDLTNVEILSKSIKFLDLKTDLDVVISAIIPVTNIEIAISAVKGADIVLVTNDYNFDNHNEILNNPNSEFKEENELNYNNEVKDKINYYNSKLKNLVGYVGVLKFPKTRNYELIPEDFFQEEIKKSIMKAGLNSLFNMVKLNQVNQELNLKDKEISKFLKLNEKLNIEYNSLFNEYETIKNENYELKNEMKTLNIQLDEIKSEFSDFKNRFSNIHNKEILEIFSLSQLWEDSFSEVLDHENHVILATNKFKPDNVIIGQGLIGATSKNHAVEWLKIVRTSLIFIKHSPDLSNDFDNDKILF